VPKLTDAELLTLAVLQALGGYTSEARWLRHARTALRHLFPYLPRQSGYNKRLRAAWPQIRYFIRALATDTDLWADDVWVADPPRWSAAVAGDGQALGAGRLGWLRLLPLPLPLVLGVAAAPGSVP
jgi:hypothetical protein